MSPHNFMMGSMTLLTAHKILISAAIVFFFGLALWELRNYLGAGDGWILFRCLLYFFVAVGFGVYLKSLKQWLE